MKKSVIFILAVIMLSCAKIDSTDYSFWGTWSGYVSSYSIENNKTYSENLTIVITERANNNLEIYIDKIEATLQGKKESESVVKIKEMTYTTSDGIEFKASGSIMHNETYLRVTIDIKSDEGNGRISGEVSK